MTNPACPACGTGTELVRWEDVAGFACDSCDGHFIRPADDPRHTGAIEVKWGVHPSGDARPTTATGLDATTVSILVSGTFRILFEDREVRLTRPGDYVLFPPGVSHAWVAEAESIVLTVRWPSRPASMVADSMVEDRRDRDDGRGDGRTA